MISLTPEQERIVREILLRRLPPGATARAFGSRAQGSPKPWSDLDLAIHAPEPLTLSQLTELSEAFSESELPFKVDVVDYGALGTTLRDAVDRDGVELTP